MPFTIERWLHHSSGRPYALGSVTKTKGKFKFLSIRLIKSVAFGTESICPWQLAEKGLVGQLWLGQLMWGSAGRFWKRWGKMRWGEVRWGELRWGDVMKGEVTRGEVRWGQVRWGEARRGEARQGKARQGKARQGKPSQAKTMQGKLRWSEAWQGELMHGKVELK